MATADELLATVSDSTSDETNNDSERIVADLASRELILPRGLRILGVESDDDVKRLYFSMPRYYGEFDLSNFQINVNYQNARGTEDVYPIKDVELTSDGNMLFTWLVDRVAFERAGDVTFSLCLKRYDSIGVVDKELNTTTSSLEVLSGLETSEAVVENNPSAFDVVLFRLRAVETAMGLGQSGHYSIVDANDTDYGVIFTIVDSEGETNVLVQHGRDGVDGNNGLDGYTPVKGVDYWTEEEVSEVRTTVESIVTTSTKEYIDSWAPKTATATLTVADWTDNLQTITVDGVERNSVIVASPESSIDDNYLNYTKAVVRCIEQNTNSLTFKCKSVPKTDLIVNIAIHYSNNDSDGDAWIITDDGQGNVVIS